MRVLRLDRLLVERGLVETREKARELILSGKVRVQGFANPKPSTRVREDVQIELEEEFKFVSRGGYKLCAFLDEIGLEVKGAICLDVGASTGGFTHCLLTRGASRVYALDVSKGQLHYSLRQDPRVKPLEGINARYMNPSLYQELIGEEVHIVTVDVSFISLKLVIPPIADTLRYLGYSPLIIALIKPQFELEPSRVKGGVVRNPRDILEAVCATLSPLLQIGLKVKALKPSRLRGTKGNQEVFALLSLSSEENSLERLCEVLERELLREG